ncbi:MAG: acetolactate synthase small subunit [Dictyoglomaceae bacterium]
MKHTLSILVENKPGVLARIAGLFSRRGYNIESLAVNTTESPELSRITLVVEGDEKVLEQITKQLYKLIVVLKVNDFTDTPVVERELALIRVSSDSNNRRAIIDLVEIFRASIVDVSEKELIIEITGDSEKIDAFEKNLEPYGIKEMVRTGKIVMARGMRLNNK